MKLKALATIMRGENKRIAPGEVFEAKDTEAEVLIAGGFAEEAPATGQTQAKAGKKSAETGDGV